jgi:regulator of replication initiation timing
LTKENAGLQIEKGQLLCELTERTKRLGEMDLENTNLKKNNDHLQTQLNKMGSTLVELKAVKDKYERINEKLNAELVIERGEME